MDMGTLDPSPDTKDRTVSIELLRPGLRVLETDAAGVVTYQRMRPLDGVEVCVTKHRKAFESFATFEAFEAPLCETSVDAGPVRLQDVPAHSDLLITYTKAGYQPALITFRTDEFDVAVPNWADQANDATYYVPLLRADAVVPDESPPAARAANGRVAIWVYAGGEYSVGLAEPVFNVDRDFGVGQAEAVDVKIEAADGTGITALKTRRDRPLFLSLPQGAYRMVFTHPVFDLVPTGVYEQFMWGGLPTATFNAIEVPVEEGHMTLVVVDGYCPIPEGSDQAFTDLATCTVGNVADAGSP